MGVGMAVRPSMNGTRSARALRVMRAAAEEVMPSPMCLSMVGKSPSALASLAALSTLLMEVSEDFKSFRRFLNIEISALEGMFLSSWVVFSLRL